MSLRQIIKKKIELPIKLARTVTEKVILTTSVKNGPVKNMREKLCNSIHSFRCTTHQEISRDVIKRLELCQTSTVFVPESCIIDKLLLLTL